MHCVDCSTYELALRGSEFELCARWKNVGYWPRLCENAALSFNPYKNQLDSHQLAIAVRKIVHFRHACVLNK